MGVSSLWSLLAPCGRRCSVNTLEHKRVAVDASIWLIQFIKAMREHSGEMIRNAPLLGLLRRLCKLVYLQVRPVIVFDGATPTLKKRTVARRRAFRQQQEGSLRRTAERILLNQLKGRHLLHGLTDMSAAAPSRSSPKASGLEAAAVESLARAAQFGEHDAAAATAASELQHSREAAEEERDDEHVFEPVEHGGGASNGVPARGSNVLFSDVMAQAIAKQHEQGRTIDISKLSRLARGVIVVPNASELDESVVRGLPTSLQAEVLEEMKAVERNRRRDDLVRGEHSVSSFSLQQLHNYLEVSKVAMRVEVLRNELKRAREAKQIASDAGREYVLIDTSEQSQHPTIANRQQWCEDGDTIGGAHTGGGEGTREDPITNMEVSDDHDDDIEGLRPGDDHGGRYLSEEKARQGNSLQDWVGGESFIPDGHRGGGSLPNEAQGGGDFLLEAAYGEGEGGEKEELERFKSAVVLSLGGGTPLGHTSAVEATHIGSQPPPVSQLNTAFAQFMEDDVARKQRKGYRSMRELSDEASAAAHPQALAVAGPSNRACCSEQFRGGDEEASAAMNERRAVNEMGAGVLSTAAQCRAPILRAATEALVVQTSHAAAISAGTTTIQGNRLVEVAKDDAHEGPIPLLASTGMPGASVRVGPKYSAYQMQAKLRLRSDFQKPPSAFPSDDESHISEAEYLPWRVTTAEHSAAAIMDARDAREVVSLGQRASSKLDTPPSVITDRGGTLASGKEIAIAGSKRSASELYPDFQAAQETSAVGRSSLGMRKVYLAACSKRPRGRNVPSGASKSDGSHQLNIAQTMKLPLVVSVQEASAVALPVAVDVAARAISNSETLKPNGADVPCGVFVDDLDSSEVAQHTCDAKHSRCAAYHNEGLSWGLANALVSTRPTPLSVLPGEVLVSNASKRAASLQQDFPFPRVRGIQTSPIMAPGASVPIHMKSTAREQVGLAEASLAVADPLAVDCEAAAANVGATDRRDNWCRHELAKNDAELDALREQQRKARRDAEVVTEEMLEESKQLISLFGVPYLVAPMEAEAQCAQLELAGLVDGVVTEDNDTFLFGGRRVYRNLFDSNKEVEAYDMCDIEAELALSREKLVALAQLLGSDYADGVHGIGIVNAMEVLSSWVGSSGTMAGGLQGFAKWCRSWKEDGSFSSGKLAVLDERASTTAAATHLREFKRKHHNVRRNWVLPDDFPNHEVELAYLRPEVDPDTTPCNWGRPDLQGLRDFCADKFGWDQAKSDELLLPAVQAFEATSSQARIPNYFLYDRKFARICSHRLAAAVGRPMTRLGAPPSTASDAPVSMASSNAGISTAAISGRGRKHQGGSRPSARRPASIEPDSTANIKAAPGTFRIPTKRTRKRAQNARDTLDWSATASQGGRRAHGRRFQPQSACRIGETASDDYLNESTLLGARERRCRARKPPWRRTTSTAVAAPAAVVQSHDSTTIVEVAHADSTDSPSDSDSREDQGSK